MSIQTYNITYRTQTGELKTEKQILKEYFNELAKECRKNTQGKTYEELDNETDRFKIYANRLGFFNDKLNYTISEMLTQITYKKHRQILQTQYNNNIIRDYEYTDNPLDDCNEIIRELRKKLNTIIKIYEDHEFKNMNLIKGYGYY